MSTTILQASVSAGKTDAALNRLITTIADDQLPFARAWVLLATKRQEVAFRQRLADYQQERAVYFNAEFFSFYDLNARLLNLAGTPSRRITEAARLGILRQIIREMYANGDLDTFASIADTVGFVRVVADLLYELKQNLVYPETYLNAAASAKDRELATIYDRYQTILHDHDLVDREGEGWLALDAIEKQPSLPRDVALLLVDGYDQFSIAQAAMLARLSQRVGELVITLTTVPQNDNEGEGMARRFSMALDRLQAQHEAIGAAYHTQHLTEPSIEKHPDLVHLGQHFFDDADPIAATGGVTLIEAPDEQSEVAAVLRDVKRRLLAGTSPDDILIALRDFPRYYTTFEMYRRLYDLPLLLHHGEPVAENPAVTALLNALRLCGDDPNAKTSFRRRDLLDVLRSPYIDAPGLGADDIALLERISREQQVLGGQQNWLDAIDAAAEPFYNHETGEERPALLAPTQAADLSLALEDFCQHMQPPVKDTVEGYIRWLEDRIGDDDLEHPDDEPSEKLPQHYDAYTLDIPCCIRDIGDHDEAERLLNRDIAAVAHVKELLHGMVETQDFLRTTVNRQPSQVHWRDFFAELQDAIENITPTPRNPIRSGRVLVTSATDARGLPHRIVYVLGLAEGIFPAEQREDPLYLDSERRDLDAKGVTLQTTAERADDTGIFYELISQPATHLTLSRPTIREGKPWVESHLWRMTRNTFEGLEARQYRVGEVVPVDEVSSLDEVVLAVADGLTNERDADVLDLRQWLAAEHSAYWQQIQARRATDVARQSRQPHDAMSGVLQKPVSIEVAADYLDPSHRWSASQLNDFGACGYRFFAKRLLRLEALDEPAEGLDPLQLGSLNHHILERTYDEIRMAAMTITPENQADALAILDECADEILLTAERDYQFRASALWQQEQAVLRRRLENLVALDFSDESPLLELSAGGTRKPYRSEWSFGFGDTSPVTIPLGEGESVQVVGSIDRVDIVNDETLLVVDYKTGSTKIYEREMREGRNFQMMVYLLALDALITREKLPYRVGGGAFWHIRNGEISGKLIVEDAVTALEPLREAMQHAAHYVQQGREGNFAVQPNQPDANGRCVRYCDYYQLCRLAVTNQHKRS